MVGPICLFQTNKNVENCSERLNISLDRGAEQKIMVERHIFPIMNKR